MPSILVTLSIGKEGRKEKKEGWRKRGRKEGKKEGNCDTSQKQNRKLV